MHYEVRTPDRHFFTHFSANSRAEAEKKVLDMSKVNNAELFVWEDEDEIAFFSAQNGKVLFSEALLYMGELLKEKNVS